MIWRFSRRDQDRHHRRGVRGEDSFDIETKQMKKPEIGLGRAHRLCQMSRSQQLAFIAEGLPIILASAQGFWAASRQLADRGRDRDVLEGFATEEAAKILILMDVVRCPPNLLSNRLGTMIRWFYNHFVRLVYARAAAWRPMQVAELRECVERERKSHYIEGSVGEYIVPNWSVYRRESQLYADIEVRDDGEVYWSTPTGHHMDHLVGFVPAALRLAECMAALGLFTTRGLTLTADVWSNLEFVGTKGPEDARRLASELMGRLIELGMPTDAATQEHVDTLFSSWQLPMYHLDFTNIDVSLDDLKAQQEATFWSEFGGY